MLSICLISSTLIAFLLVIFTIFRNNYFLIKILFISSYLIFIFSYLYTVLINPGIPRKQYFKEHFRNKNIGDKKSWQKCSKCNILIPKVFKAAHCSRCEICVREQDHHCPWTGKCIGKYNLISFYIFVNSLFAYILMIFVILYGYIFYTSNSPKNKNLHKI
jgi:hypothetical protein